MEGRPNDGMRLQANGEAQWRQGDVRSGTTKLWQERDGAEPTWRGGRWRQNENLRSCSHLRSLIRGFWFSFWIFELGFWFGFPKQWLQRQFFSSFCAQCGL